MAPNLWN